MTPREPTGPPPRRVLDEARKEQGEPAEKKDTVMGRLAAAHPRRENEDRNQWRLRLLSKLDKKKKENQSRLIDSHKKNKLIKKKKEAGKKKEDGPPKKNQEEKAAGAKAHLARKSWQDPRSQ